MKIWALGCLSILLASCAATDVGREAAGLYRPVAEENRQILVTFVDERNDRVPVADPATGYRQRGGYGNTTWSENIAKSLAADYGLRTVTQWPINSLGIHCVVYEVPRDHSLEGILETLARDKRVEAVQTMKKFKVSAETYDDPYYSLQTDARAMHLEPAHRLATGRNIRIALIDTGVDKGHPDLKGQIERDENFVANSQGAEDIHGTAVAGIIAAIADNHQGIVGMAPGSKLIALKACWQTEPQKPEASCNSLTLALALNAAINAKASIINMSLAGPKDPLLERLIAKATKEGIIVVASDTARQGQDDDFPASIPQVIAARSQGSQAGHQGGHTVSAPGLEILTTLPHGTYNFMSGSSFAAAHVSGLIALLLELNPHLTPEQTVATLNASMHHSAESSGFAVIDACLAAAKVSGAADCSEGNQAQLLAAPSHF